MNPVPLKTSAAQLRSAIKWQTLNSDLYREKRVGYNSTYYMKNQATISSKKRFVRECKRLLAIDL